MYELRRALQVLRNEQKAMRNANAKGTIQLRCSLAVLDQDTISRPLRLMEMLWKDNRRQRTRR